MEQAKMNRRSSIMRPDFQVGTQAVLEPHGIGERFKSRFIGWEPDKFVAFQMPTRLELREHLYKDKPLIVRYLHRGGQVCGFESPIQAIIFKPHNILFVDYPPQIEVVSLREHRRAQCYLPCVLFVDGAEVHGAMLDISCGGCRFVVNDEKTAFLPDIQEAMDCMVEVRLFGEKDAVHIAGDTKKVKHEEERLYLGLAFKDISPELSHEINAYVDQANEFVNDVCGLDSPS
ncbi:MAG: flagellar brake domain-containing protein [Desulfovibrionaceae bacterium]